MLPPKGIDDIYRRLSHAWCQMLCAKRTTGRDEKEEIDARYASVDDRSDRAVEGVQYALGATRVQGRCPKGSIKIRGCNEKE